MGHSVAIVGFGSAGQRAFSVLQALLPKSEFLIVTSQSLTESGARVTSRLEDAIPFAPDTVVVAGPATSRRSTVAALSGLGAKFFLEKPLADSLSDAMALSHSLGDAGVHSQVGYNLRFSESLGYFRDHIRQSTFGPVLSIRAETGEYLPEWRPGSDYRRSVSARADLGGGVLLELSHELDYLRWIFGPILWVSAWTGRTSSLEIDVEDTALVSLGFKERNGRSDLVATLALDFVRRDRTRFVTALCEEGTLRWDGIADRVEVWRGNSVEWEILTTGSGMHSTYQEQWKSFAGKTESVSSHAATLEDGIEVLRGVEAIRLSHSKEGLRVGLSEIGVAT